MNAINLGQGFPDWATPTFVKEALKRSVDENANQYCRSAGHPPLVQQLAKRYVRLSGDHFLNLITITFNLYRYSKFLQRDINWETEVTVGVGATETLFAITQSLINEGYVFVFPANALGRH